MGKYSLHNGAYYQCHSEACFFGLISLRDLSISPVFRPFVHWLLSFNKHFLSVSCMSGTVRDGWDIKLNKIEKAIVLGELVFLLMEQDGQ